MGILHQTSRDIFDEKKAALEQGDSESLEQQVGGGKDLMSILCELVSSSRTFIE